MTTETDTTVTYHDGSPAINVKVHAAGYDFWPPEWFAETQYIGSTTAEGIVESAYNVVQRYFWDEARSLAAPVLGAIYADGRSGGWLVIDKDPTYGGDDDAPREWLAEYRELRAWAEAFIADAPERVRSLARQIAMDEAGRGAAHRMFAFEREAA